MNWTAIGAMLIAITRDVRQSGLAVPPRPEIYFPATLYDTPLSGWSLLVRSPLPAATLAPVVRRAIRSVDPDAVIYQIRTVDEVIADSVSYERIVAALLLCFSVLALGLASLGIYGVVSYAVTERSAEFAIRAALGAGPGKVMQIVATQGLALAASGLALGSAAVIPLNSVLANFLFGVTPLNGLTFVSVLFILALSGMAAVFLPALRAAKVDPMRVLRQE